MKSLNMLLSKLFVGLFLILPTIANAEDAPNWVGSPEASMETVWVPAEAVATDLPTEETSTSPATKPAYGSEGFSFPWIPGTGPDLAATDSQVVQASYEEPVYSTSPNAIREKIVRDLSDPGLIVPLEEMEYTNPSSGRFAESGIIGNSVDDPPSVYQPVQYLEPVATPNTMVSNSMVPGSLRVLQTSNPMMVVTEQSWEWQLLPSNLLWHSYLAGPREPRISSTFVRIKGDQDYWDATVGGRASLLRYGNDDPQTPEGWEIQLEGAAFPRLTLDYDRDLVASDYRFGFPLVYKRGAFQAKFSYYHISAHLGDEYLLSHFSSRAEMVANRINYSRDALTLAIGYFPWRDLRLYGEVGYAVWCDGGSRPWEFQFGIDYSPVQPTTIWGAPFFALNGHLHQELNYGGGFTAQAGVQWRGQNDRRLRFGFQYFNGMSEQYQFFRQFEQQIGGGIWYDF